ncbi:DUF3472 domain-containing protein [Aeoliella sp. ICT_H6.2]|uniref:DUF3472 domain-containing protein n=1 Tax=Aeoliella straminimaris TaxID=2954799 RepID=A0A9X2F9F4_9BACT|nr:DUF3472 domain-containing protein [Aeoliella straminimaris]MCO6044837.1 DUF3472 domain-containing protein [Aeoliella straminimaris]
MKLHCIAVMVLLSFAAGVAGASERLTGIACRSVHLQYPGPESVLFYNEMTVKKSAPGSYFMACGFGGGYFGIQQLADDRKLVLFSVWEPGNQNDPNVTPEDRRVKELGHGEGVRVKRFGGEGTGGQSFYDFDWKLGTTYRFVVTARVDEGRTIYTGYFHIPEQERWQQMAVFSTPTNGRLLRGYNSFVEDFRRNRDSTTHTRKAAYGNGWVQTAEGDWHPLATAKFTADSNRSTNIDAGLADGRYFLATGGDISNEGVPLWKNVDAPESEAKPPQNLPKQAAE